MRISFDGMRPLLTVTAAVALVVMAGWGQTGPRRVAVAAQADCAACHDGQAAERKTGKHEKVSCETCHGAQPKHIESAGKEKPAKPDVKKLCLGCHEKADAKPVGFPQVPPLDHYPGTPCNDCHKPHQPAM